MLHAIRAILLADSKVTDLVSTRITTGVRPQAQALPAIVLEEQSTGTNETKNTTSGLDEVRFTVTSFSESYAQALDIGDKCREALDLFIGQIGTPAVNFDEIRYNNSTEEYFDTNDSGIYHRTLILTAYVKLTAGGPNYPAGVNEPVTIQNTDATYNQSAAAGSTHIIADITVSNSDDSYSVSKVAAVDVEVPDTTIKRIMRDGSTETYFTAKSAADHTLQTARIEDETGTQITNYGVGQRIKVMSTFTSSDVSEDGTRVTITPAAGAAAADDKVKGDQLPCGADSNSNSYKSMTLDADRFYGAQFSVTGQMQVTHIGLQTSDQVAHDIVGGIYKYTYSSDSWAKVVQVGPFTNSVSGMQSIALTSTETLTQGIYMMAMLSDGAQTTVTGHYNQYLQPLLPGFQSGNNGKSGYFLYKSLTYTSTLPASFASGDLSYWVYPGHQVPSCYLGIG